MLIPSNLYLSLVGMALYLLEQERKRQRRHVKITHNPRRYRGDDYHRMRSQHYNADLAHQDRVIAIFEGVQADLDVLYSAPNPFEFLRGVADGTA